MSLQSSGRTRGTGRIATSLFAFAMLVAMSGIAVAASVTPTVIAGADNTSKTCAVLMPGTTEYKIEPVPDGTYTSGDGTLSVTVVKPSTLAGSLNSFDWTSNIGVLGVIVKNGVDGANWYDYGPVGSTGDTYLTTPFDGAKGISHISFCYQPPMYEPLTAAKTADGTYRRDITWTLTKTADPAIHIGDAGETAGSSIWKVTATKTIGDPYGYEVTGDIEIFNPNDIPVDFSIADTLSDGTVATVTCPYQTVPAKGSITCTYEALPDGGTATVNRAVVTSLTAGVGGAVTEKPFLFIEQLNGYGEGTLSDPRFSSSEPISGSTTWTFDETFACPADASLYKDGAYSFTEVNKAYLDGNIGLEASADVDVTCHLQPLVPAKAAAGTYERTVTWDLTKSVTPAVHTGYAGETAGSSTWTVTATKTETLDGYQVAGTIEVYNPSAVPQVFSVADVLDDGTEARVSCPGYTAAPLATVECTYVAYPLGDSATKNTVTVSMAGNPEQTAVAPIVWSEILEGEDEGSLSDPRFKFEEQISESTTRTFDETFTCPAIASLYNDGVYSFTEVNEAYLDGNIGLAASADVDVTCDLEPLVPTKTAYGDYDKIITWTLEKTVDPDYHYGAPGYTFDSTWQVVADKTVTYDNHVVKGTISVYNPAAIPQTFMVEDFVDGTQATVTCPTYTVEPDETVVCTYLVYPNDKAATNTATVEAPGNGAQNTTATIEWTETVIGHESGTLSDPRFGYSASISNDTNVTFPEAFACPPLDSGLYVGGAYEYTVVNTVYLNGGIGLEDSATVKVRCEDVQRPSIQVSGVTITAASKVAPQYADGTFLIENQSGGDWTHVKLGTVTVTFTSTQRGGIKTTHTAVCVVTPEATGYVLEPHEAKSFSYHCTEFTPPIPAKANELTAVVTVEGAWNQLGEYRDMTWRDTSSPYKLK